MIPTRLLDGAATAVQGSWAASNGFPPPAYGQDDALDLGMDLGRLSSTELMNLEDTMPDNFWQYLNVPDGAAPDTAVVPPAGKVAVSKVSEAPS